MNEGETPEKWSEKQIKFIHFVGRGKRNKQGERKSNEDFARAIGVDPWTLYQWQKLPGFKQAVWDFILEDNMHYLPDLMKSQVAGGIKKGKGGETPAATLILKSYQLLMDKVDHTTNGRDMPTPILGGPRD